MDGFLLSVHGEVAMFALQLINGTIRLSVDQGDGPIWANLAPKKGDTLYDGEWHFVEAKVQLDSSKIALALDNVITESKFTMSTELSTVKTNNPLYLGGHPHPSEVRNIQIQEPFNGCIRNVKINDVAVKIKLHMTVKNVRIGVCPLN